MDEPATPARDLMEKILDLPPEKIVEVEEFVDFLRSRLQEATLTRAVSALSEGKLHEVWDNPDDAPYDSL